MSCGSLPWFVLTLSSLSPARPRPATARQPTPTRSSSTHGAHPHRASPDCRLPPRPVRLDHLQLVYQNDDTNERTAQDDWYVMEGLRDAGATGVTLGVEGWDGRTTLAEANAASGDELVAKIGTPTTRGSREVRRRPGNAWRSTRKTSPRRICLYRARAAGLPRSHDQLLLRHRLAALLRRRRHADRVAVRHALLAGHHDAHRHFGRRRDEDRAELHDARGGQGRRRARGHRRHEPHRQVLRRYRRRRDPLVDRVQHHPRRPAEPRLRCRRHRHRRLHGRRRGAHHAQQARRPAPVADLLRGLRAKPRLAVLDRAPRVEPRKRPHPPRQGRGAPRGGPHAEARHGGQ